MTKGFPIALSLLFTIACANVPALNPRPQSDWTRTLYYARQNVDAGNYFAADKLLDEFARTHPDTREAREIGFWKAAYQLDPANPQGSLASGISGLDSYLSANPDGWYRNEATVLRRTAVAAQAAALSGRVSATATDSSSSTGTRDTVVVVTKSREEEIASLRDQLAQSKAELAKVSAELDRIKKRLANPSN